MSVRENIIYYIQKNIFIVLVLIGLCPLLALSYAKFTTNSESYRSNEMYISELLYSIKIDGNNVYSVEIESGETEHTIEITSLNAISTNYKLAYLTNTNLEVRYASDYLEPSLGGILTKRTISLTVKNTSAEKQTLSLMVFGGYSFNDVDEVKVLDTYTEIDTNYLHYDYETTALYVDNTRVDKLDNTKKYNLVSYTCSDDAKVSYDTKTNDLTINTYNQTKCSLYFEEYSQTLADLCQSQTLSNCLKGNYIQAGLTKVEQSATGNQNYDTTEYRYQGKTPNNYITFNGETGVWRIIGVFEVETPRSNGTYKKENKVKLVRESIGTSEWNEVNSAINFNDWTTATLMTTLNSGDYYNRTGTYASNGLTDNAKNQISTTKWYLGNVVGTDRVGYGTTKEIYTQERSESVWDENNQTWDGEVGLIYSSDYMYASSSCYNDNTMKGYNASNSSEDYRNEKCISTNWLYTGSMYWTVSPSSGSSNDAIYVDSSGHVNSYYFVGYSSGGLHPSTYLDTSINYVGGSGTIEDPFTIK